LTGLIGAISAKYLFNFVGGLSAQERGFALGTASHGIGAARAMQVNTDSVRTLVLRSGFRCC